MTRHFHHLSWWMMPWKTLTLPTLHQHIRTTSPLPREAAISLSPLFLTQPCNIWCLVVLSFWHCTFCTEHMQSTHACDKLSTHASTYHLLTKHYYVPPVPGSSWHHFLCTYHHSMHLQITHGTNKEQQEGHNMHSYNSPHDPPVLLKNSCTVPAVTLGHLTNSAPTTHVLRHVVLVYPISIRGFSGKASESCIGGCAVLMICVSIHSS